MSKRYRDSHSSADQILLLPPSLHDWLPDGHAAYFVLDTVEQLDLSTIERLIQAKDPRGERPYSPAMMVALLFYAYMNGVFSSRRIARRCLEDVAFRVISGNHQPAYSTINAFRRTHLEALSAMFVQVLRLCEAAGLVQAPHVHQDGTKIQASASKHKAMSYDRMKKEEARLKAEINELLDKAEEADAEEDARLGKDKDGSEGVVDEIKRRESRRDWIRKAKAALEAEAKKARASKLRENAQGLRERADIEENAAEAKRKRTRADRSEAQADDLDPELEPEPDAPPDRLPKHRVKTEPDGTPKPKAQRNFTDPDSRIMKDGRGAFMQSYNGQIAVDEDSRVIVASELSNQAPDQEYLEPVLAKTTANLGRTPETWTGDAGYFSEANVDVCEQAGCTPYLAPGRQRRQWPPPDTVEGAPPDDLDSKERMRWQLRTREGRERMRRRKFTVEPVFGIIKEAMGFKRFLLRGMDKVRAEWNLVCIAYNLRTLHSAQR